MSDSAPPNHASLTTDHCPLTTVLYSLLPAPYSLFWEAAK